MSTPKKRKPMTAREKKERAETRVWLRAKGMLPPPKKPLNRKRFCEEAEAVLDQIDKNVDMYYILWALGEMLRHTGGTRRGRTLEAVGAAKVLKLAKAHKELAASKRADDGDKATYTIGELLAVTEDIYRA